MGIKDKSIILHEEELFVAQHTYSIHWNQEYPS